MMSLWDALRMNMMISYQELVRTFPSGRGLGIGDNTLNFSAYLEKISTVTNVTPGDFEAVTNFTLAYE